MMMKFPDSYFVVSGISTVIVTILPVEKKIYLNLMGGVQVK